jgi:Holliday junction resolvase-like predicted endonuclease
MTTVSVGRKAEQAATQYLAGCGFMVLENNWRTKYCEIDIIALKKKVVYFVEVKYRQTAYAGSGLDYISSQKLRHMRRAAELWVLQHGYKGQYQLAAIEVSAPNFTIGQFVDELYA